MFKFGFLDSENVEKDSNPHIETFKYKAKEIVPASNSKHPNIKKFTELNVGDVTIQYCSLQSVLQQIAKDENKDNIVLAAECSNSDLVKAEYEGVELLSMLKWERLLFLLGGLKVWECTIDLVNYLHTENIEFKNKTVLDLGCGTGIVGIYTLMQDAHVDFQDYNEEVITYSTIPNCFLNSQKVLNNCQFYSGDWQSLLELLNTKEILYDYILTSETIYNVENYNKLHNIFEQKLKKDGVIYLAAKTYYFGVGGSTRAFEKVLETKNNFKSSVVWTCTEGVQREIIKIYRHY